MGALLLDILVVFKGLCQFENKTTAKRRIIY